MLSCQLLLHLPVLSRASRSLASSKTTFCRRQKGKQKGGPASRHLSKLNSYQQGTISATGMPSHLQKTISLKYLRSSERNFAEGQQNQEPEVKLHRATGLLWPKPLPAVCLCLSLMVVQFGSGAVLLEDKADEDQPTPAETVSPTRPWNLLPSWQPAQELPQ